VDVLDLLWQLQKHDDNLSSLEKKLVALEQGEKIKQIANRMKKTEFRLTDLKFRMEQTEKDLSRNNFTLKDLDYKLNKTEKELYEGNISDIRQLGYLDKEKDLLRQQIDNKEMEILSQMEEMENLKKEFVEIEIDFKELKIEYGTLKKECKELIENLKKEIIKETLEKEKIVSQINEEVSRKYNQLKKIKGNAIVEIIDNKCSGCNVLLPTIIIDRLKFQNEIVYCENCGRILYYQK